MLLALPQIAPALWVLLAFGCFLVGIAKTAVPGISTPTVAIFAAILPPKASTAALLIMLMVGDLCALLMYRRHADWRTLMRLFPTVAVGMVLGAAFLLFSNDAVMRRVIGVILLVLIASTLWQRRQRARAAEGAPALQYPGATRVMFGALGGFTSMVANAGGAVMSMYFLAARFPVKAFLGTVAWFFTVINLVKLPVLISMNLYTAEVLSVDLVLFPFVILGCLLGRWITSRIKPGVFEWTVIVSTTIGAGYLLF